MPLYFTLSGLFFKSYGGIKGFCLKKTNNILVPYLFWFLIGVILAIALDYNEFKKCESYREWQDLNVPIWFLLCLFNANLIFYVLQYYLKGYRLFVGVCVVSAIGIFVSINQIKLPFEIGGSCRYIMFFYMGYMLKDVLKNLQAHSNVKYLIMGAIAVFISYAIYFVCKFLFVDDSNVIQKILSYLNSAFYVVGFLLLCKVIVWLPIISYIGRHSIIVLCSHWLNMKLLYFISGGPVEHWLSKLVFMVCLLVGCWLIIPISKKLIPYFVAQKPLLKQN